MKVVAISDTHGKHEEVVVPDGDLLIHAGDCTSYGHAGELKDFIKWFAALPHGNKVLIGGNHDWIFDREPQRASEIIQQYGKGIIYLENAGLTVAGLKIWGSPVTPPFCNWAFNWEDTARRELWARIPQGTDILVTHGPMLGGRDWAPFSKKHVGDSALLARIQTVWPLYHICGHIHFGYGTCRLGDKTTEVNASVVNEAYEVVNEPIVFEI